MSLTSPVNIPMADATAKIYPVLAGTAIYTGALVELTGAGYLQPWTNSTNEFMGVALEGTIVPLAENSQGGVVAGGIITPNISGITVGKRGRLYRFPYSSAALSNVGSTAYATDDHTIALSGTYPIGMVAGYESGYLWLDLAPTTITVNANLAGMLGEAIGTSVSPTAMNTPGAIGLAYYLSTSATSSTTYGTYTMLTATGIGVEAIAARSRTYLSAAGIANASGHHATLELDTAAGSVTGLGTGLRGNIVMTRATAIAAGTYYGVLAEIFPNDATSALPAGSNACLCCNAQTGTASDLTVNAIAFGGADGTGKMIYTATESMPSATGSIRILVNGAVKYLYFGAAQA